MAPDTIWELVFLMVILKIPIVYLCMVIYYAVKAAPKPEEVARAADLLGRRWVLAILWASAEAGAVRFNEFKQALDGIPPRTLAQRLADLEAAGVVERRVVTTTRPPRVEYRLTEAGERLRTVVDAFQAWAAS